MALRRSGSKAQGRLPSVSHRSPLFWACAVFLLIWVACGGGDAKTPFQFYLLALSGSCMIAIVIAQGAWRSWGRLPLSARISIALFILIPLVQCLPLPPGVWHFLPGRELVVRSLTVAGLADNWQPLTLQFVPTFTTFLLSVWLLAFLVAVISLQTEEVAALFLVLLGLGILQIALGFLQVAAGGAFILYDVPRDFLLGFFANKNHAGLFMALLLIVAWALFGDARKELIRQRLPFFLMGAMIVLGAIVLTFSRAGLAFGIASLAAVAVLSRSGPLGRRAQIGAAGAIALAFVLLIISSTGVGEEAFGRFGKIGEDLRLAYWIRSWELVGEFFPAGSGIGSFSQMFLTIEKLEWLAPSYLNHAHNEYIEQLVEMGILAPVLWVVVGVMVAGAFKEAWLRRHRSAGRLAVAGGIIVVFALVHSVIDYPLRRPAIGVVFILGLASLLRVKLRHYTIAENKRVCEAP